MKKPLLIALICLPFLTGCVVFDKFQKQEIPVVGASKIIIDENLLRPCDKIPNLEAEDYEALASHYLNLIGMYGVCAIKQDNSIRAMKTLQGQQ